VPAEVDDHPTEEDTGNQTSRGKVIPQDSGKRPRKRHRFAELFAGFAGLTEAVKSICAEVADVTEPHDKFYGSSLENDQEFLEMNEQDPEETADWKHFAPPCRTMTKARRHDRHGKVRKLRSSARPEGFGDKQTVEANLLADRTAHLCERQVNLGKFFSVENPEESYLWELKSFKRLAKLDGVRFVVLDQCAYGGPYKKATGVLTNCPWLYQARRCADAPPHHHTVLEGKVYSHKVERMVWFTSEAAEYPTGLCEAWAHHWRDWLLKKGESKEPAPTMRKVGVYQNKLIREELPPKE